ncbi:MAG: ATPase [Nitrospinae bacterium RIFCSPLOWO2_01_FULL_39_10]|nr:MAG: ATPase [Nitrospinae bacterium RIFCSPLOWO2_01_FULL_39_10]
MQKDILKTIITDSQEKDMSHVMDRDIQIPLNTGKVISLVGVRRSGKTHLLYSIINKLRKTTDPKNIVYINFEDDRLFPLELKDLTNLLDAYYELYPDKKNERVYFFFDEIQNVQYWEKFIRRLYDTENCTVFITGSSAKLLSREIATTLRGRTLSYEVFPLSFSEFLRFKKINTDFYSSKSLAKIKNAFSEYLIKGGFPEIVNYDSTIFMKTLQEYIDLIMFRDVIERYNISNTFLLKRLIKFCFTNIATHVSFNKLYNDFKSQGLSLSRNTVYEYIACLEDAFALFTIPIYAKSVREQWRNPRKIYTVDVGFKTAMDYPFSIDIGRVFENIVFLELRRQSEKIYYFKGKHEVDFYYTSDGKEHLLNVSYDMESPATRAREIKGLIEAMKSLSLKEGSIITAEHKDMIKTDVGKINVIPLWEWLLEK